MKIGSAIIYVALAMSVPTSAWGQTHGRLQSSSRLMEDPGKPDSWTYRNPGANLAAYQSFIIDPTAVYADPSATWGGTTPQQRQKFADLLSTELRKEIGKFYPIVDRPGPGVARMRLTLLGVETTKAGVATASKVTPFGLALNGVKSLAGKPGSFMGSVQVAFELTDSRTGELLYAAVRRRSPNALDIEASLSTEKTVESVAEDIADAIRKGLDKVNGR